MKKFILSMVLVLSCALFANSQLYLGGTLGFSYSKLNLDAETNQSGTSFKFLPEIGWQINNKFAAGITIGYIKGLAALGTFDPSDLKGFVTGLASTATDVSSDDIINTSMSAFRIAPYSRYTVFKKKWFEIFIDGVIGFNFGKAKADNSEINDSRNITTFEIAFKPGVAFEVTKNIKLFAKLAAVGFQHASMSDSDLSVSRFALDVDGNNILFGMTYKFDMK